MDNTNDNQIKPKQEDKLYRYTQIKFILADQIRILRDSLTVLDLEESKNRADELMVKLAEDRFILAVLGQFKRGKSSLMNAIIGRELLPVGVLPLTSVVTTLRYGPKERLLIRRKDSAFTEELPVSSLDFYVTEKSNPGNKMNILSACIEMPVPFMRRGIEFADTPGIGSSLVANTELTYKFLPECDAVIFVTGIDTPLTNTEISFLQEIRQYVDKIFIAVNKTDLLSDDECGDVLSFIDKTVKAITGRVKLKLYPVSARNGLSAKKSGDDALYKKSGIYELEEALTSFLTEEKSAVFLTAVMNKTLKIIDDETRCGSFDVETLKARIKKKEQNEDPRLKRDPGEAAALIQGVREKIDILKRNLLSGETDDIGQIRTRLLSEPRPVSLKEESEHKQVPDFVKNLRTRGCPVCLQAVKYLSDYFAHFQFLIVYSQAPQIYCGFLWKCF